jgi:hypothetical protein
MAMDPQEQEISVSIQKASSTATVIEAGIRNVLDKNLVIGDRSGAVNKLTLINQDDEEERVTYYLHTDGTVNTTNSSRVSPVFASTEYVNGSDFAANAEKRAVEALTPQQFNNLIELTFRRDDQIIDVATMAIGTMASIIDDGNVYKSILTGYAKSEDLVTLVFGIVRADLTKKLIIERRANAVPTPIPSVDLSGVGNVFGPLEHAASLVPIWDGSPDSRTLLAGKALSGADDEIVTGTVPGTGRILAANADGDVVDGMLAANAAAKHVNRQDHTTNNTVSDQLTQNGFRYIQGNATSSIQANITFPVEFDAKPIVHVTLITGAKLTANGAPADVGDFPETLSTNPVPGPRLITATGFSVVLWRSAALANNSYYGITWEAKGTKART